MNRLMAVRLRDEDGKRAVIFDRIGGIVQETHAYLAVDEDRKLRALSRFHVEFATFIEQQEVDEWLESGYLEPRYSSRKNT